MELLAAHHGLPPPLRESSPWTDHLVRLLTRCPLRARRASAFRSIAAQVAAASPRSLAAGTNVAFEGEPAYDAGGVTLGVAERTR